MKERLEQRLQELKAEYESGRKMMAGLETRREELRNTLMRISGAILVLEEELGKEVEPVNEDVPNPDEEPASSDRPGGEE